MPLTRESALRKDRTTAGNGNYGTLEHRHFATIAAILRDTGADSDTCEVWADRLQYTNPRFDRGRFLRACQA